MMWFASNYGVIFLHSLILAALFFCKSKRRWQIAQALFSLHLTIAIILFGINILSIDLNKSSSVWFRSNGLSLILTVLISFIGLLVLRYAKNNLRGDPDNARFLFWYLGTLLAVGITITTNHIVIFLLGWIAISLNLNQLLLFYPERPRAVLAAHKKFLFARLSEVLLISAFLLLYFEHRSFEIDLILSQYQSGASTTFLDQVIALLIASVAIIKCAQLPFHGWLIQVVEAPTPVSALLHAGIVNLGGFLLLLFSPLLSQAFLAQWLILIVAGLSCVFASLVMITRISIKVKLAWSTLAQMGLMLLECALGLYELALLHLIAHSCYKAHAFLSTGEAVNQHLRKQYADAKNPQMSSWLIASGIVLLSFTFVILLGHRPKQISPIVLIVISLITLFAYHLSDKNTGIKLYSFKLAALGLFVHTILILILTNFISHIPLHYSFWADVWVSVLFIGLFIMFLILKNNNKHGRDQNQWFIALNAGFYLDEWITRATLWIWPTNMPTKKSNT